MNKKKLYSRKPWWYKSDRSLENTSNLAAKRRIWELTIKNHPSGETVSDFFFRLSDVAILSVIVSNHVSHAHRVRIALETKFKVKLEFEFTLCD